MINAMRSPMIGLVSPLGSGRLHSTQPPATNHSSPADFTALSGTWVEGNKATPSVSTYAAGKITVEHLGDNKMTRWHTAVSSGDFDVGFKVRLTLNQNNFVASGAFAGTSSGAEQRLESVGYLSVFGANETAWQWWRASDNGFIGEGPLTTNVAFPTDQVEYWRIKRTGATIFWFKSLDGSNWDFVHRQIDDGFMQGAADRVGVLLNTNAAPSGQINSITVEGYAGDLSAYEAGVIPV